MSKDDRKTIERDTILDSIADGVFTVDKDWRVRSFNKAAERITGIAREQAIGVRCCDVFRASICESSCALRETMKTGKPVVSRAIYIIDSAGKKVPVSISTALLKDSSGRIIGGVETFRDMTAIERLRRELEKRYSFHDIIGKHPKMLRLYDILPSIAESNSNVVIVGESGTGKEMVARAIHNLSHRKDGPLIAVNCGALPDTLLEAELFGYKKGAFTGAQTNRDGRFAKAEHGTIFLDEIGDVSPALQVRLLRVLQERKYEPLGSSDPVDADVRVIAASNRDLSKLVEEGKFREDLYYRINVITIELPPLRERREDIPLLIDHFLDYFGSLDSALVCELHPSAMSTLMEYDYPGNVRELRNIIEHACVLSRGSIIEAGDLPQSVRGDDRPDDLRSESFDELEARFIESVLARNDWNRTESARELGIHKTTLWRKMKKLGITPPSSDVA